MFLNSIACLGLLITIANKMEIFSTFNIGRIFKVIKGILENTYVSGIMCSIIAVVVIYVVQVKYSKIMLKKDVRCNEIIYDIFDGIEEYCNIVDDTPKKAERKEEENYYEKSKKDALMYYHFYEKYRGDIIMVTLSFSAVNTDILIDSVQSCFFLNLNFKLLNIVNNIKNRLPNLRDGHPKIEEDYKRYKEDKEEEALMRFGRELPHYLTDLHFMAMYWNDLLKYLNYDPTYIKLFIKAYNSKYDIMEDIKQSKEVLRARNKEINKIVRKAIITYKWKHFFKRD